MEKSTERVNHPSHYQTKTGIECIEELNGAEAVNTSRIIKYIWRWKKKNGLEDLKKARFYLDRLIKHVEKTKKGD